MSGFLLQGTPEEFLKLVKELVEGIVLTTADKDGKVLDYTQQAKEVKLRAIIEFERKERGEI